DLMAAQDLFWALVALTGILDPGDVQKIATGQRNSSALRKHTPVVLVADADSHIKFGDSSVTADTNDFLLPAKVPMRFFTGLNQYVAVTGGNVWVGMLKEDCL